jgi:hypothetical protein
MQNVTTIMSPGQTVKLCVLNLQVQSSSVSNTVWKLPGNHDPAFLPSVKLLNYRTTRDFL